MVEQDRPIGETPGGAAGDGRAWLADEQHLVQFAASRADVEAFVEPGRAVTETTVVLVAGSGEWTRRRVPGPQAAHQLARRLGIPAFDASVVGYPTRMRAWSARLAAEAKARRER
jgi:hypothetical protein